MIILQVSRVCMDEHPEARQSGLRLNVFPLQECQYEVLGAPAAGPGQGEHQPLASCDTAGLLILQILPSHTVAYIISLHLLESSARDSVQTNGNLHNSRLESS